MDLKKLRDGNFFLKTAMKTAVKTFTSVWINYFLFMRINAIRFLQSKGTINIQILNIRSLFLSVLIS